MSVRTNQIQGFEENGPIRKQKRGVLPKQATEILRSWLFSHIVVSLTKKNWRIFSIMFL